MARFYFHLRAGELFIPDAEGVELEDHRASARHLMLILDHAGSSDHRGWTFEICDERGEFVDSVPVVDLLGAVH